LIESTLQLSERFSQSLLDGSGGGKERRRGRHSFSPLVLPVIKRTQTTCKKRFKLFFSSYYYIYITRANERRKTKKAPFYLYIYIYLYVWLSVAAFIYVRRTKEGVCVLLCVCFFMYCVCMRERKILVKRRAKLQKSKKTERRIEERHPFLKSERDERGGFCG